MGGRRDEALESETEQTGVEGMYSVDILCRIDGVDHGPDPDARREWHLHDDARHGVVGAEGADGRGQGFRLIHGTLTGDIDESAFDPDGCARLQDSVQVDHRRRGASADHDREARRMALGLREGGDIGGDTGADLVRDRGPLEEPGAGLSRHASPWPPFYRHPTGARISPDATTSWVAAARWVILAMR